MARFKQKVKINKGQCQKIGDIIKSLKVRPEFYQREFLTFQTDKETKFRTFFYSVAICHQAHTLVNRRKNLKGWDYLESVFLNLGKNKSFLLEPDFLASSSVGKIIKELKPLFSEDGNPKNCTLDRLEERAVFLKEISERLKEKYESRVSNLINLSDSFLINKGKGLYERLSEFKAYADPFKKKSTVFIKFLIDAGLLKIKDYQNFIPIMDYQMQRVLLRMGCVEIVDQDLRQKLIRKEKLSSDTEIRSICVEAMRVIAKASGHEVIKMNDFFYTLGRSCCHEKILCFDKECDKKPCTFYLVVNLPAHKKCVFERVCRGSVDEQYRNYWQPIVETHYY